MNNDAEDDVIDDIRLRSQRFVQIVFTAFTLVFAGLALVAHHAPDWLALTGGEPRQVADTFLVLSAAYVLCLLLWERVFAVRV